MINESINAVIQTDGTIRSRKGWSTFRGMVWQLWLINKRYKKMGVVGDFTVRLPLKGEYSPFSVSIRSELIPTPTNINGTELK